MDEVVEAIEKYHGFVPLVYDITTMSLVEARAEEMQYAVYLKREADKEITRQKYKRCLNMAKWCDAELSAYQSFGTESPKEKWWQKWHNRWLSIADKFKEK